MAVFPAGVDATAAAPRDADYLLADVSAAERWHFWFQSRRRLVLWMLEHYCPSMSAVLDVGCGTGFVLEGLHERHPAARIAGCDVHRDSLEIARAVLPTAFVFRAVADRLPFADEFDALAALDVIEHIDDDVAALRGMHRAIKPGGALLLTVPQHPWLWSAVDGFSCHRRRYTREELVRKVRAAGFDVIRCTSFFTSTLPLVVVSRLRGRSNAFDPVAEFRIPRSINTVLNAVMECEWWVIKAGMSLPIGGSLMIVARRPLE